MGEIMMALLEKDLFINVYIKIICFYCIYISDLQSLDWIKGTSRKPLFCINIIKPMGVLYVSLEPTSICGCP